MPIVNYKGKNLLFIHIPKTGGTSIEKWMSDLGKLIYFEPSVPPFLNVSPQHFTFANLELLLKDDFFDIGFSVVRNPYSKLESEYFFRTKPFFDKDEPGPNFSNWLIRQLERFKKDKFHFDNHFRPQVHFLSEKVKVFKYEDGLEKVTKHVSEKLKIDTNLKLKRLNKAKYKAKLNWTNEAIDLVNKIYKRDFETFGYEMKNYKINIKKS